LKEGERTARNLTKNILSIILAMTLSAVVLPLVSGPEPADAGSWRIEIVDSLGDVGYESFIALDNGNNPRISYLDWTYWDLKYAKRSSGSWINETVDSTGPVGNSNSLALDSNDYPSISYGETSPNFGLKFAKWNGSSWISETVDSFDNTGRWTSLALDSNDYPHISYWNDSNGEVRYAKWNGSSWSIEIVDILGHAGSGSSLVLDSNEYPHISYPGHDLLYYAKWNGSSWSIDIVDSNTGDYSHNSMALDSNDYPHISYGDGKNHHLKYAKWNGSSWSIETVDSSNVVGDPSSLDIDSYDYPHISYHANSTLRYAKWDGNSWNTEIVDSACTVDYYSRVSIITDSRNIPHISYYDGVNLDLKYATKSEFSLPSPLPPTSLRTKVNGSFNVRLDWVASKSPNVTHYLIYRSEDQTDFDLSTPVYDTSSDPDPLGTNWTDTGAASTVAPSEYYYIVRVVNRQGLKSITSNTAGKWTKQFNKGLNAFSLPLEPFEEKNISWYADNIPNATHIRWIDSSGRWVTYHRGNGSSNRDTVAEMGSSYETYLQNSSIFTFCGYPGSMIRFVEDRVGESISFRKSLNAVAQSDDVILNWLGIENVSGYDVYRSHKRNGLHNLSLQPVAEVDSTRTSWRDVNNIGGEGEYYYLVIPVNASGGLGSSPYSIGIFIHTLDWFCDSIPNVVGMVYLMFDVWKFHAKEMPEGVYDISVAQSEGFQISIDGTATRFTFIGY
jgi:hypothetical protein